MATTVSELRWKNIPTQVQGADEAGNECAVPLDERFQHAVDALAMQQGLAGTDEYLEHWTWTEPVARAGGAAEAAAARAAELDAAWPRAVPAMVERALRELA